MKYKHGLYFDYPEDLHAHMISPKQVRDVALDGKFPYYNKGFWFRVLQVLVQIVMILIVFPANYFRYGLKIKGKSRLIQYRKAFDNGCITICNHVFEWDYICVRAAMGPRAGGLPGRHHLLPGHPGGAVAGPQHGRPEAAHRAGGGPFPGHALLEEPDHYPEAEGRETPWLRLKCWFCGICARPSIPAPLCEKWPWPA